MTNEKNIDVEPGQICSGKVVRIMPYGAFVEILPGKDGLVHISELSVEHIPEVESVVSIGDEVNVMVVSIDDTGRVDLSHRAALENEELDDVIERRKSGRKSFSGDRRNRGRSTSRRSANIDVDPGQICSGKVVRIMPYGAFVEILPGQDGLVHISELSAQRIPEVESVVSIGDEINVMVISIDDSGRVDLSHRAATENEELDDVIERRKSGRRSGGGDRRDRSGGYSGGFGGRNDQRGRRDDNNYNSSDRFSR